MNCMSLRVSVKCDIVTFITSERLVFYTYWFMSIVVVVCAHVLQYILC